MGPHHAERHQGILAASYQFENRLRAGLQAKLGFEERAADGEIDQRDGWTVSEPDRTEPRDLGRGQPGVDAPVLDAGRVADMCGAAECAPAIRMTPACLAVRPA